MVWPQWLARPSDEVVAKAGKVRLAIFDVDGALTDGRLIYGDDGQEYKAFHSRDGLGMKMLASAGIELAIITGRTSQVVVKRAENLGIHHLQQGCDDKLAACDALLAKTGYDYDQVAYLGDDFIDLSVMRRAGLSAAVADAHPLVIEISDWHTANAGGRGAARELCELLLAAQGKLDDVLHEWLG